MKQDKVLIGQSQVTLVYEAQQHILLVSSHSDSIDHHGWSCQGLEQKLQGLCILLSTCKTYRRLGIQSSPSSFILAKAGRMARPQTF